MKVTRTFTFIISRNFGHPFTWSVDVWQVYAGGIAAGVLLLSMVALSLMYLLLQPRMAEMERTLEELRADRDALREAHHSANEHQYAAKGLILTKPREEMEISNHAGRPRGFGFAVEERYIPPLRLGDFRARRHSRSVEVIFRIVAQGDPGRQRGGFLFAVFENEDADPVNFRASPRVVVNERGFPQLYKSGIRFSRVRKAQTYRRKVALSGTDDYYTHVTLYLFSLRGGLLAKERHTLERSLFIAGA